MAESKGDAAPDARLERMRELLAGEREPRSKKASWEYGKSLRKAVPRDVFSFWQPPVGRVPGADLIFEQDLTRVPELVGLRHARMAVGPFAFYRGAAIVMAQDLQSVPTTGIEVQAVGDAHIANFGFSLSPERRLVFDVNDFDECARGPWEWDVARLATSVEICGRERELSVAQRDEAIMACVAAYRTEMRALADMGNLKAWYAHAEADELFAEPGVGLSKKGRKKALRDLAKSEGPDGLRAALTLAEAEGDSLRVVSAPPKIVPVGELVDVLGLDVPGDIDRGKAVSLILKRYRDTLPPERARLLESYRGCDIAHMVASLGSVGIRAWLVVLEGADEHDTLVLQIKEATESVLERYVGKAAQPNHGQRVVEGQRAMQAMSDIFLGWTSLPGSDGQVHDYYVRQLWDARGMFDLKTVTAEGLLAYAKVAGEALACAHARTGDRFAIASYLGRSDRFDCALVSFARAYAAQNEADYEDFCARI